MQLRIGSLAAAASLLAHCLAQVIVPPSTYWSPAGNDGDVSSCWSGSAPYLPADLVPRYSWAVGDGQHTNTTLLLLGAEINSTKTWQIDLPASSGVFPFAARSVDGGAHWQCLPDAPLSLREYATPVTFFAPATSGSGTNCAFTCLAGGAHRNGSLLSPAPDSGSCSFDGGLSWQPEPLLPRIVGATALQQGSTIYYMGGFFEDMGGLRTLNGVHKQRVDAAGGACRFVDGGVQLYSGAELPTSMSGLMNVGFAYLPARQWWVMHGGCTIASAPGYGTPPFNCNVSDIWVSTQIDEALAWTLGTLPALTQGEPSPRRPVMFELRSGTQLMDPFSYNFVENTGDGFPGILLQWQGLVRLARSTSGFDVSPGTFAPTGSAIRVDVVVSNVLYDDVFPVLVGMTRGVALQGRLGACTSRCPYRFYKLTCGGLGNGTPTCKRCRRCAYGMRVEDSCMDDRDATCGNCSECTPPAVEFGGCDGLNDRFCLLQGITPTPSPSASAEALAERPLPAGVSVFVISGTATCAAACAVAAYLLSRKRLTTRPVDGLAPTPNTKAPFPLPKRACTVTVEALLPVLLLSLSWLWHVALGLRLLDMGDPVPVGTAALMGLVLLARVIVGLLTAQQLSKVRMNGTGAGRGSSGASSSWPAATAYLRVLAVSAFSHAPALSTLPSPHLRGLRRAIRDRLTFFVPALLMLDTIAAATIPGATSGAWIALLTGCFGGLAYELAAGVWCMMILHKMQRERPVSKPLDDASQVSTTDHVGPLTIHAGTAGEDAAASAARGSPRSVAAAPNALAAATGASRRAAVVSDMSRRFPVGMVSPPATAAIPPLSPVPSPPPPSGAVLDGLVISQLLTQSTQHGGRPSAVPPPSLSSNLPVGANAAVLDNMSSILAATASAFSAQASSSHRLRAVVNPLNAAPDSVESDSPDGSDDDDDDDDVENYEDDEQGSDEQTPSAGVPTVAASPPQTAQLAQFSGATDMPTRRAGDPRPPLL